MTFGLTPTGWNPKTAEDILGEIETDQRAALGADLDTSAESVVGDLNAVIVTQVRQLWELGAAVYSARDPAAASFAQLDATCALTGTARAAATKGRVTLTLTVAAGAVVPPGSVAQVPTQPTNRWATLADADNTDGLHPTIDVEAHAQTAGRITANAGTITGIATPVAGWTAVTNALDAAAGTDAEADPPLRARREAELSRPGSAPVPALRADLLDVPDVVACTVEENATQATDALGRPPHSVEAVVQFTTGLAGDELDAARFAFATQLFASKAGGIDTYGQQVLEVFDPQGAPVAVRWNEATLVPIYVAASLTIDPDTYVGDVAVQDAVVAFGAALVMGDDVIRSRLSAALVALGGVLDVVALDLGLSSGSVQPRNVAIGARALATFDTANITVST